MRFYPALVITLAVPLLLYGEEPSPIKVALNHLDLGYEKIDDTLKPIDTSEFQSSKSHWRNLKDESRFIQVIDCQASYEPAQVQGIVDNILLFQLSKCQAPIDLEVAL